MFIEKIWSMTIWLYTITIKWEDESSLCETVWNPQICPQQFPELFPQ